MAKLVMFVLFAAFVATCYAASFGGVKDFAGNYYDFTTGQYSSALTGKVYNTAPVVVPSYTAPLVAPAAAYAPYAPYYYGAYPYAPYAVAPVWK